MNKKGFTLVELLVVIAIIGILSSVAVINLNSARNKAKTAAAQATVAQLTTPVILCLDGGSNLNAPAALNTGAEGGDLCNDDNVTTLNWPALNKHGYNYINNPGATGILSDNDAMTWTVNIPGDGTLANIICDQSGCRY